jgi:hypothetical protein
MTADAYRVTCEKCGGSDVLKITSDRTVFYTEHTPIIAARFRPDMHWGFECLCGQDSRIAPEERDSLDVLIKNASESTIKVIAKSLTAKNELKFRMEPA